MGDTGLFVTALLGGLTKGIAKGMDSRAESELRQKELELKQKQLEADSALLRDKELRNQKADSFEEWYKRQTLALDTEREKRAKLESGAKISKLSAEAEQTKKGRPADLYKAKEVKVQEDKVVQGYAKELFDAQEELANTRETPRNVKAREALQSKIDYYQSKIDERKSELAPTQSMEAPTTQSPTSGNTNNLDKISESIRSAITVDHINSLAGQIDKMNLPDAQLRQIAKQIAERRQWLKLNPPVFSTPPQLGPKLPVEE